MTTTNKTAIMTPAQFTAARALAKAYYHLWSSVPDATYNIEDIKVYGESIDNSIPGITYPSYREENEELIIGHVTGTGRLDWDVYPSGNVHLRVYRPGVLSQGYGEKESTLVAEVWIINDDTETFNIINETAEIIITTGHQSVVKVAQHIVLNPDFIKNVRYEHTYDSNHEDQLLCERHVAALIRPIVALLEESHGDTAFTMKVPSDKAPQEEWTNYYAKREEWREKHRTDVILPMVAQVKAILAPLFEMALPDPITDTRQERGGKLGMEGQILPDTFWSQPFSYEPEFRKPIRVHHKGEEFLVETEHAAVYMTLLLRKVPEMTLLEAYEEAMFHTNSIRP